MTITEILNAIVHGGWVTMTTALLLVVMSIASLAILLGEYLLQRRILLGLPTDQEKRFQESIARSSIMPYRMVEDDIDRAVHHITNSNDARLSLLASIGVNAPYIGLFGTVTGVMSAMEKISGGRAVSIADIGPAVGEALIMTAFGLFVAIPAVLGHNYLHAQRKRIWLRRCRDAKEARTRALMRTPAANASVEDVSTNPHTDGHAEGTAQPRGMERGDRGGDVNDTRQALASDRNSTIPIGASTNTPA